MKIQPIYPKTNSGKSIIIREVSMLDAEGLKSCTRSYLESNQIPLTADEFEVKANSYNDWIRKFREGKNDLLLVAEHNGQIIGNVDLSIHDRSMLNHTGYVGMGVHKSWQGDGIGTLLLSYLIDWVKRNHEIEIVWLQVYANNQQGIKLYSSLGFEETGNQKRFVKLPSGEYVDNLIMTWYK